MLILKAKKRDGAELSEVVAWYTDCDRFGHKRDERGQDLDATQLVTESACNKRKEDEITKEMMQGAGGKAVQEVLALLETREQRLTQHWYCFVKNAVNTAVTRLTRELHGRMTTWESKMKRPVGLHFFYKSGRTEIVQLESGSEHRVRLSIQTEVDKKMV